MATLPILLKEYKTKSYTELRNVDNEIQRLTKVRENLIETINYLETLN